MRRNTSKRAQSFIPTTTTFACAHGARHGGGTLADRARPEIHHALAFCHAADHERVGAYRKGLGKRAQLLTGMLAAS
ncbi:MAG: hypothetical protein WDN04_20185 [Rhodospirillales bacterium]